MLAGNCLYMYQGYIIRALYINVPVGLDGAAQSGLEG